MQQRVLFYFIVSIFISTSINAQQANRKVHEQCATMAALELKFEKNPQLKARFELQEQVLKKLLTKDLIGFRQGVPAAITELFILYLLYFMLF